MHKNILPYIWLSIFATILLLPGLNNLPVIDRDEAHFAQATRQMLQTQQYGQIRFQEKTRFQKPPGINWLQAISVNIFSTADNDAIWPYRIPSFLAAFLSIIFTFIFGKMITNARIAFLAAMLLGSSLLFIMEAHMAVIDSALLFSVLLMQGALWKIYHSSMNNHMVSKGYVVLFWLALSFGFLLKGVTPLVGFLTILSLCIIERDYKWLKNMRFFSGLLSVIIITSIWVYVVNEGEQTNYIMQMFHKDLLPKLQGGHESHGQPPLFHLAILIFTFWPASLLLAPTVLYACKERKLRSVYFLLSWIIPSWIFFELMPTKLPQYVLPLFPAIALLMASAIYSGINSKWMRAYNIAWTILSVGILIFMLFVAYKFNYSWPKFSLYYFLLPVIISFSGIYWFWKGNNLNTSIAMLLLSMVSLPIIFAVILPKLDAVWVSQKAAKLVKEIPLSAQHPLLVAGFSEPSLVFYLNTSNVRFIDVNAVTESKQNDLLLVDHKFFPNIDYDAKYRIINHISGFNYSKGKWVELLLVQVV